MLAAQKKINSMIKEKKNQVNVKNEIEKRTFELEQRRKLPRNSKRMISHY